MEKTRLSASVDKILNSLEVPLDHQNRGVVRSHVSAAFHQGKAHTARQIRDAIGAISQDDI